MNIDWVLIGNISALLGILGTIFSLLTLIKAFQLKAEINKTIERLEYKTNYEDLYAEAASFITLLEASDLNVEQFKTQLHKYLYKLKANYTFFPPGLKRIIKKIVKFDLDNQNQDSTLKLIDLLTRLEVRLKKEGKQT